MGGNQKALDHTDPIRIPALPLNFIFIHLTKGFKAVLATCHCVTLGRLLILSELHILNY